MLTSCDINQSLRKIESEILGLLKSVDKSVFDIEKNPLNFMGKASRAKFTMFLGDILGVKRSLSERTATCAELIHTASLLHDDCIDKSSLRRGVETINKRMGVNTAILLGNLTVSFALDSAGKINPQTMADFIKAIRKMTEGALLEENLKYKKISLAEYDKITSLKTASLFNWCAQTMCYLSGRIKYAKQCLSIAESTGKSFQIIDDILDFETETEETGKDTLKDITDGKITLPLILALNDEHRGREIEDKINRLKETSPANVQTALEIAEIVKSEGFTAKARKTAEAAAENTLAQIDELPEHRAKADFKNFIFALTHRKN